MFNQSNPPLKKAQSVISATNSPLNSPPLKALSFRKSSSLQTLRTGDSRSNPFRINTKSSYSDSDRVGDKKGNKFYQFKLTRTREVRVFVTNLEFFFGPSLDFRLLDSKGKTIKSREVRGANIREIERDLKKGTYYIKIESNGESVPYRLRYRSEAP